MFAAGSWRASTTQVQHFKPQIIVKPRASRMAHTVKKLEGLPGSSFSHNRFKIMDLSGVERKSQLAQLEGWTEVQGRDAISKSYKFKDFTQVIFRIFLFHMLLLPLNN